MSWKTVNQKFKEMPLLVQGIIVLATSAIAIGGGILIYKKLKSKIDTKGNKEEGKQAGNQLEDLEKQGIKPTFSDADAQTKVNVLKEAANGCDPLGQGSQQIMAVIYSLKNQADFYLLSKTFGVQTWDDCGIGTGDVTGSLSTLLTSELDGTQMSEVRRHLGQFKVSI